MDAEAEPESSLAVGDLESAENRTINASLEETNVSIESTQEGVVGQSSEINQEEEVPTSVKASSQMEDEKIQETAKAKESTAPVAHDDVDTDDNDVMEVETDDDDDDGGEIEAGKQNGEEDKTSGKVPEENASVTKPSDEIDDLKSSDEAADVTQAEKSNDSSDADSISEVVRTVTKPAKRRVVIDWVCVNPNCTRDGKSNPDVVTTATHFVLGYFGVKVDNKKRKVCFECREEADSCRSRMIDRLRKGEPLVEENFPIPPESTVTLEDSDQELHTDSSSESEYELNMTDSNDDEGDETSGNARDILSKLIDEEVKKLNVEKQVDTYIGTLSQRMDTLKCDIEMIDKNFADCEKMVDQIREDLYRPFRPKLKFVEPVDLNFLESQKKPVLLSDLLGPLGSYATKGVNSQSPQPQRPQPPQLIQVQPSQMRLPPQLMMRPQQPQLMAQPSAPDIVALPSPIVNPIEAANLPPVGELVRPVPKLGDKLFAMRGNLLNVWKDGLVIEVIERENEKVFRLRFDVVVNGKLKSVQKKNLPLKHLAYTVPSEVRLQVGTRIIGAYKENDDDVDSEVNFYSGIIAEPPKQMNRFRYLVFFDDGYASYISHKDIRVVCYQSPVAVWDDVDPNSREFIQKYLKQYPDRPMVKLAIGQVVRTEWNTSWWHAQVEAVDASLVKLFFHTNGHREWVYRGSTRLGPLFLEFQEQKKFQEIGSRPAFSRRNINFNRNRPYIEYTRQIDEETSSNASDQPAKRAVARKSTTMNKKPDSSNFEPRERWDLKGSVLPVDTSGCIKGMPYVDHTCSKKCLGIGEDDAKFQYFEKDMKGENPLIIPMKLGWQRQIAKFNNNGRRQVFYIAPCGRRLRSLEEVHRYLRVTKSNLEIDFFNFEWFLHVFNEFTPERKFCSIQDICYGKENVAISCVNSIDKAYPEYVEYSTERIPQNGVNINLEDGFLTCCDCVDDCQDREKCACWQMTINHTIASNPEARVHKNVGYHYRRLLETVTTGIFECNKMCKCKKTCLNRVAQHPLRAKLQLFKTESRGWGVRTLCDIPRGGFICIYVGKLYTNEEANKVGQESGDEYFAELDLIEVVERNKEGYESDVEQNDDDESGSGDVETLSDDIPGSSTDDEQVVTSEKPDRPFIAKIGAIPSDSTDRQTRSRNREKDLTAAVEAPGKTRDIDIDGEDKPKHISTRKFFDKTEDVYIMDAKDKGNIGRYLNHSCSPNVFVQNCFVDTHDLRFPWVSFFALDYIPAGHELCWDYAYIIGQVPGKEIHCECGAENCRGRLL